MRIISGHLKGRRIQAPRKLPVRPTTDRAKEGLFNILQHRLELDTLSVLDLFSGTGNMSYEFASRGTPEITAIDQNRHCVQFINQTSELLNLNIQTLQSDCFQFLEKTLKTFDLIFADPPYAFDTEQYEKLIALGQTKLKPQGILIIEHFEKIHFNHCGGFNFNRSYGKSTFSFFGE